jgi:hypothetical protein
MERFEEDEHLQWKLVQVEELYLDGTGDKSKTNESGARLLSWKIFSSSAGHDLWQQDFPDSSTSSVDVVAEVVTVRKQAIQVNVVNADRALKEVTLEKDNSIIFVLC